MTRRTPEEAAEMNLAFLVFMVLIVLGFVGSALAVGSTEVFGKMTLFTLMGTGSSLSFYGLNAFHRRRVAETGDPRTTVYSAFAIYSSLAMSVLCASLVFILFGRFFGVVTEDGASHVSYYFVTVVALVTLAFGVVCFLDTRPRYRGLLARRIYLWPWSHFWSDRAKRQRFFREYDDDRRDR